MKAFKKLQIAAAAVVAVAGVGTASAAILNSTGALVATETVWPKVAPAANGSGSALTVDNIAAGRATKVRAPAFIYSYEGGIVAGANSEQYFSIQATLNHSEAEWASSSNVYTDALVPTFSALPGSAITDGAVLDRIAETIAASLRGVGDNGRRIAVVGAGRGATLRSDPVLQAFFIELYEVRAGQHIAGIAGATGTNSPQALTYLFRVVNTKRAVPASLSALDLTFNTGKSQLAAPNAFYVTGSAEDSFTTDDSLFAAVGNVQSLVSRADGDLNCRPDITDRIGLTVFSGEGVTPFVGPEPNNTGVGGTNSTTVQNYLSFARGTDVKVVKAADRTIATTNSFQTNLNGTPTNGIGGTGGGRFTFAPTDPGTVTNRYGPGSAAGNIPALNTGNPALDALYVAPGFPLRGVSSGDERFAKLGTVRFERRSTNNALDRLIDVDRYSYSSPQGGGFKSTGRDSLPFRYGDFTQPDTSPVDGTRNVFGGIDLNTLEIRFKSKPNFGWRAANGRVTLVKSGACVLDGTGALTGQVGSFAGSNLATGDYLWTFTRAELLALSGASLTLDGDWSICYSVPGTTSIPAATFTGVVARLTKDDFSEQDVFSCPSTLASIYGGVKVDVRNWVVSVPGDDTWSGVTRIINNSEVDTATVEGQFIHPDSGAYGPWGTIAGGATAAEATALNALVPALKPRAVAYLFNSAIAGKLVNPSTAPGADNSSVLAAAAKGPGRLRVSADVSTIRVQSYIFNSKNNAFTEASASQGADFVNVESSNRDHIDQDAQRDIAK